MPDMARRGIFTSLVSLGKNKKKPVSSDFTGTIRPPYCSDENLFHQTCPTCVESPCVTFCEEGIINIGEDRIPYLDFKESGCTFCGMCEQECPHDVLSDLSLEYIHAIATLNIQTCMAWNGIICSSCLDVCETRAIKFLGIERPQVVGEICTGCGECYRVCPAYAITINAKGEVA